MFIADYVGKALRFAKDLPDEGASKRVIHRNRSKAFVEALADALRNHYANDPSISVLSKHYTENRCQFGVNELLYDILVCEAATVSSAAQGKPLTYITRAIWQIESEFARDTCQAMYDFNKLVIGSGENKLFIGPRSSDDDAFLLPLAAAAAHCTGSLYAALVPHPGEWDAADSCVRFFEWRDNAWVNPGA